MKQLLLHSGRICIAGLETKRPTEGFTAIELLVVMALVAVLATLAYPSFIAQVRESRRAEALVAIAQVLQAQERWRAQHSEYAQDFRANTGLGLGSSSSKLVTPAGHYQLTLSDTSAFGYQLLAQAQGGQAADKRCAYLRLTLDAGSFTRASGPTPAVANDGSQNKRCWKQ